MRSETTANRSWECNIGSRSLNSIASSFNLFDDTFYII
jgi:hypothetical protein